MKLIQRSGYRARQFWQSQRAAPLTEEEWIQIRNVLHPAEIELYSRQSRSDRYHAYRVMCTLRAAGHDERDLLAAALLHDVGKSRSKNYWWDKPLVVLIQGLAPGWSSRLAKGDIRSWKRPFVIRERHPRWGADAARKAGSSATTVALIRRHQDRFREDNGDCEDRLLAMLQWADDKN